MNAALFKLFMRDIVVPKRAGAAVIRRWVDERPELRKWRAGMIDSVRALKNNDRFQRSLFNRTLMPRTFDLFDSQPEFSNLSTVLKGYERRG